MTTSTRELGDRAGGRRVGRRRREHGAGLVEYALLVALILMACIVSLQVFGVTNGGSINDTASTYGSAVN